jgi:hypothetical protein
MYGHMNVKNHLSTLYLALAYTCWNLPKHICSLRRINQEATDLAHFRLQTHTASYD